MKLDMETCSLTNGTVSEVQKQYKNQKVLQKKGSKLLAFASAISGDFIFYFCCRSVLFWVPSRYMMSMGGLWFIIILVCMLQYVTIGYYKLMKVIVQKIYYHFKKYYLWIILFTKKVYFEVRTVWVWEENKS